MRAANNDTNARIVGRFANAQTVWALAVALLWIGGLAWLSSDQDYTSGELLDHLMNWMHQAPLYSDPQQLPYRVFNYPPLGLAIVRMMAATGIPELLAGRAFGTLGIVAAVVVAYKWMRELGARPTVARATIALAGTSFPLLYSTAQFHIEGVAVALTVLGVRFVWRGTQREMQRDFLIGGLLMSLACFVKQTQVLSLCCVLLWFVFQERRHLFPFASAVSVVGVVGGGCVQWAFGAEAWRHMFTYTVGTYSLDNLALQLASHALPWLPIAVAAWFHLFADEERRGGLLAWYLAASTLILLSSARVGSGFQYFVEWQLVVLIAFALALENFANAARMQSGRAVAGVATMLVLLNVTVTSVLWYNWKSAKNTQLAFQSLCRFAPTAPALLPTENAGAARACGAQTALHPFIIANLTARGLWNEQRFVDDLLAGRFPALLLPFNPAIGVSGVHRERWSPGVLSAMRQAYHPLQQDHGWWLLVPVHGAPENTNDR